MKNYILTNLIFLFFNTEMSFSQVEFKNWDKGTSPQEVGNTNKKNDHQYYLDRARRTGDNHGQASILWCASAFLR